MRRTVIQKANWKRDRVSDPSGSEAQKRIGLSRVKEDGDASEKFQKGAVRPGRGPVVRRSTDENRKGETKMRGAAIGEAIPAAVVTPRSTEARTMNSLMAPIIAESAWKKTKHSANGNSFVIRLARPHSAPRVLPQTEGRPTHVRQ